MILDMKHWTFTQLNGTEADLAKTVCQTVLVWKTKKEIKQDLIARQASIKKLNNPLPPQNCNVAVNNLYMENQSSNLMAFNEKTRK